MLPDDLHRARCRPEDSLRDTAAEKSFNVAPPTRSNQDQIGIPGYGVISNLLFRHSPLNFGKGVVSGMAQHVGCARHNSLRFTSGRLPREGVFLQRPDIDDIHRAKDGSGGHGRDAASLTTASEAAEESTANKTFMTAPRSLCKQIPPYMGAIRWPVNPAATCTLVNVYNTLAAWERLDPIKRLWGSSEW